MNEHRSLRLVFAGTPEFAAAHLQALLDQTRHSVIAVYSQPDRPAGRGKQPRPSPVKQLALAHQVPVRQPVTLRDPSCQAELAALAPDLMVVVAYGLILPPAILDTPALGCINVHASLLPRWRGAAPIQRAIEAGDTETGIAIMQMDAGLDTGPVLLTRRMPISPEDTGGSLHDKLAKLGPSVLLEAIDAIADGRARSQAQTDTGTSYARKIDKAEARIDWHQPATQTAARIRALSPFPASWSDLDGVRVKFYDAQPIAGEGEPGRIIAAHRQGLEIACGDGAIRTTRVQLPGGRPLTVTALLNARADQFAPGRQFL